MPHTGWNRRSLDVGLTFEPDILSETKWRQARTPDLRRVRTSAGRPGFGIAVCLAWLMLVSGFLAHLSVACADDTPPSAPSAAAKAAIAPVAPIVPAEVIAAMQGGEYETARRALIGLAEKTKDRDDAAYFAYLQAIAERLSRPARRGPGHTAESSSKQPRQAAGPPSSVSSWRASSWPRATRRPPRS